ncbi:MAG: membrane protein insertase YidC [Myxococcaceae bacterium]
MNPDSPDLKRLFLAVFLMTALLMGYNAFFVPKTKTQVSPKPEATAVIPAPPKPILAPSVEAANIPLLTRELAKSLPDSVAVRGGYKVLFSNEGAALQDWALQGYQEPLDLKPGFVAESRDGNLTLSDKTRYELVSADLETIIFQKITPENIRVIHKYHLTDKPFVVRHEVELKNQSTRPQALSIDMVMHTVESAKHEEDQLAVTWHNGEKHKRYALKDLEEKSENIQTSPKYVGFDRRYFLMSLAPENNAQIEGAKAEFLKSGPSKALKIRLQAKTLQLQPGASQTLSFSSYLGPKQLQLLQTAGHGIEENIDYGWFGVLSRPLLWLLVYIFNWVHNFGIAIILLTVFIKILTFPLTQKSFTSQQEMKKIAPELKELQKKYSHDKAMLGQKQMAFYKEKGINPMAGCLPMLIQMPVWFALYQMLGNSVELYEQPFYAWITDLTRPDPYYIFPVVMGLSMLISQWVIPPQIDESQPQMKYVMWFMPLFLTFVMLNLPAGLSLYMLVNNLLTIAQQVYVRQVSESKA